MTKPEDSLVFDIALRGSRRAFDLELDLQSRARSIGVFGASGSGKTSLLRGVAGLSPELRGHVRVAGSSLLEPPSPAVPVHERRIGVVFQDARLFPHLSVEQNLRFSHSSSKSRSASNDEALFASIVELFELGPLLNASPREISGGEARRVAIGRALLSQPRALLLDEPFAGLDDRRKRQIEPFLLRLRDEFDVPTLIVSHDLSDLAGLVDEYAVIEVGRVVAHGDAFTCAPAISNLTRTAAINAWVGERRPSTHLAGVEPMWSGPRGFPDFAFDPFADDSRAHFVVRSRDVRVREVAADLSAEPAGQGLVQWKGFVGRSTNLDSRRRLVEVRSELEPPGEASRSRVSANGLLAETPAGQVFEVGAHVVVEVPTNAFEYRTLVS